MENILIFLGFVFCIAIIILYAWSIIWGYKDAVARGKNGLAVAVLIAIFSWPLGLLFWSIIRPDNLKTIEKISEDKKEKSKLFNLNEYIADFKEMPFLMKILFVFSLYFFISTFMDFVQMKSVTFEYFNSGFPKNYSFIWYLYLLLYNTMGIFIYLKRSYDLLKKYLSVYIGIGIINSVGFISSLPSEQKMFSVIIYIFTFIFVGLICLYLLKQKRYFNKP